MRAAQDSRFSDGSVVVDTLRGAGPGLEIRSGDGILALNPWVLRTDASARWTSSTGSWQASVRPERDPAGGPR